MNDTQKWKKIIKPRTGLFNLNLKETWAYRDLIALFVKRDFTSKYKQTILGPAWAIIQPLFTTVIFTIIFGNLAKLTTLDVATEQTVIIPSFLFYMIGNIVWSYFSTNVTSTSNTFIGNSNIMGKVYFPRLVTPIATSLSNLISFFIQLVLFLIIFFFYVGFGETTITFSWYFLLIPVCIIQMVILSVGVGIIISSLTTKYRDLAMALVFCMQLWQYASPIAYGLALIPEKYTFIYMLNPISPIITTIRYGFFGIGYFNIASYLISWAITILFFLIGLILFNRIEKNFMDTI